MNIGFILFSLFAQSLSFFPDRSETESYLLQKQLPNEQKGSKESHHFKKELANQGLFMQGKKFHRKLFLFY